MKDVNKNINNVIYIKDWKKKPSQAVNDQPLNNWMDELKAIANEVFVVPEMSRLERLEQQVAFLLKKVGQTY